VKTIKIGARCSRPVLDQYMDFNLGKQYWHEF
jgi:hypothetical protein